MPPPRWPVGLVCWTARQAPPIEDTDLGLCHVQPTGVAASVVELDAAQGARGDLDAEDLLEAVAQVSIEDIGYQVHLGMSFGDFGMAVSPTVLNGAENVAGSGALALVVLPQRCARFDRQGRARLAQQRLTLLVQTDHRLARIVRPAVELEQFVHTPAILGARHPRCTTSTAART